MSNVATRITKYVDAPVMDAYGQSVLNLCQLIMHEMPPAVAEKADIAYIRPELDRSIGSIVNIQALKATEFIDPNFHHIAWSIIGSLPFELLVFSRFGINSWTTIEYDILNPVSASFQAKHYESLGRRLADLDGACVVESPSGFYGSLATIYHHCSRTREKGSVPFTPSLSEFNQYWLSKIGSSFSDRNFIPASRITSWLDENKRKLNSSSP